MKLNALSGLIPELRKEVLESIHASDFGHSGEALACLDLLAALYLGEDGGRPVLSYDPTKPQWEGRDRVVFSGGHAFPALTVCLRRAGFKVDEAFASVPPLKTPGIDAPIASFGEGLSIAYGIARTLAREHKKNRVYVVMTERELAQGGFWEMALQCAFDRLENLIVVCSHSGWAKIEPVQDKFEAFGWKVFKLVNGHDVDEILGGFAKTHGVARRPKLLLAPTLIGKGVPFAEGKEEYRTVLFSEQEMQVALDALTLAV